MSLRDWFFAIFSPVFVRILLLLITATLPGVLATRSLTKQLRHANQLERRKIDAGYLQGCLNVISKPLDAFYELTGDMRVAWHRRNVSEIDEAAYHDQQVAALMKWQAALNEFLNANDIARQLSGSDTLREALETLDHGCRQLAEIATRLTEVTPPDVNENDKAVLQAFEHSQAAAIRHLVEEIRRIYSES